MEKTLDLRTYYKWLVFNDTTGVRVDHSQVEILQYRVFYQSQGRRISTLRCIGSISKEDVDPQPSETGQPVPVGQEATVALDGILEESMTSLEDKLSPGFRYLKVNIGCNLPIK